MSLSSLCAEQHENKASALRKFVAFSLLGSVGLHLVLLALSQLFPASLPQADPAVIELVVTAPLPEPELAVIGETAELSPEVNANPTPDIPEASPEVATATAVVTEATAVVTEVEDPTVVESQFEVETDTPQTSTLNQTEAVDVRNALRGFGQPRSNSQDVGEADGSAEPNPAPETVPATAPTALDPASVEE